MRKIYPVYFTCSDHFEELSLSLKSLKNINYDNFGTIYIYCDKENFFTEEQIKILNDYEVRETRSAISWGGIQTIENELLAFNDIRKEIDKDDYIMNIDSDAIIVSSSVFDKVISSKADLIGNPLELLFTDSDQSSFPFQQGSCYFIRAESTFQLLITYHKQKTEITNYVSTMCNLPIDCIPVDVTISNIAKRCNIKTRYLNFIASDDISVIHMQLTKNDYWKPFGRLIGLNKSGTHQIQKNAKIKVPDWDPQWEGQWGSINHLFRRFHSDNGIWFHGALEEFFNKGNVVTEPWIGFFHNLPDYSNLDELKYEGFSLNEISEMDNFKTSLPYCKGIFVLSEYLKKKLPFKDIPVCSLIHPTKKQNLLFDFDSFVSNKTVYHIGHWLRNFESFFDLKADNYQKIMTRLSENELDMVRVIIPKNQFKTVHILPNRLQQPKYELIFESSIVFLNLFDCAACNTINECIITNTPILVNKINGVVDYLGNEYPFYYKSLEEAESKIQDMELIKETTNYLQDLDIKQKMTPTYFMDSFVNSKIYKELR